MEYRLWVQSKRSTTQTRKVSLNASLYIARVKPFISLATYYRLESDSRRSSSMLSSVMSENGNSTTARRNASTCRRSCRGYASSAIAIMLSVRLYRRDVCGAAPLPSVIMRKSFSSPPSVLSEHRAVACTRARIASGLPSGGSRANNLSRISLGRLDELDVKLKIRSRRSVVCPLVVIVSV